jgi:hypothetical protein
MDPGQAAEALQSFASFLQKRRLFLILLTRQVSLTSTTAPQIVYDDAHLRVIFQPGHADHLLVTFGDALFLADGARFTADRIVQKHGLTALGFMAKATNWYPPASIAAAQREIAFTLRAFSTRLFYGSSMGGYAAIKYSRLLGATHSVAYCPQWSIDPLDCGEHPSGYEGSFTASMSGMAIGPADIAGSIAVFFDPAYATDAFHAQKIRRLGASVRAYHVHYAGHDIAPMLRGSVLVQNIWDAVRAGDDARIYALINSVRRQNPVRRQRLLEETAGRYPHLTGRIIGSLRQRRALRVQQPQAIHMRQCRALVRLGDYAAAYAVLPVLAPYLSAARLRLLWYQLQLFQSGETAISGALTTCHGTSLFYNAFLGRLFHAAEPQHVHDRLGIFPVMVGGAGIRVLSVKLAEADLACIRTEDGPVDLADPQACDPSSFLRVAGSLSLTVTAGGRYMCAEPDGRVAYDRTCPGPWEKFSFVAWVKPRVRPGDDAG